MGVGETVGKRLPSQLGLDGLWASEATGRSHWAQLRTIDGSTTPDDPG